MLKARGVLAFMMALATPGALSQVYRPKVEFRLKVLVVDLVKGTPIPAVTIEALERGQQRWKGNTDQAGRCVVTGLTGELPVQLYCTRLGYTQDRSGAEAKAGQESIELELSDMHQDAGYYQELGRKLAKRTSKAGEREAAAVYDAAVKHAQTLPPDAEREIVAELQRAEYRRYRLAAGARPQLLRSRIAAAESSVVGDIRTIMSAEVVYSTVNGGFYDSRLACLARPQQCLPGYAGPAFIDPSLATDEPLGGYGRRLRGGTPAPEPVRMGRGGRPVRGLMLLASLRDVRAVEDQPLSATSVESFSYSATPVQRGTSGLLSYCGDSTGALVSAFDQEMNAETAGRCPTSWTPLR